MTMAGAIGDCGRSRRDKLQGGRGKCDAGLTGREGFHSRPVSIGILGDFTKSGGKLAREPARLRGNGLTDDSLAPPFGQKNALTAAQACAVSLLRQRGDKTCERRTRGHVHIQLIKNVCDLITYYTPSWFISRI